MGNIQKFAQNIIQRIENSNVPFVNFVGSFLVLVLIRNFTEMYATGQDYALLQVINYSPFYLALAGWFVWYFAYFGNEKIVRTAKVVLFFFCLILIPPLVDIAFSSPGNVRMRYLGIGDVKSFWVNLLTVGMVDKGISWGQRTEIILACVSGYFYFKYKTGVVWKSVLLGYGVYLWIFLFGNFAVLTNMLFRKIGVLYVEDLWMLAKFYYIVLLLALFALFVAKKKNLFVTLVKDIRFLRILHYFLMLMFGFFLYYKNQPSETLPVFVLTNENIFAIVLIPVALVLGAVFSIINNNLNDYEIDKISNPNRPHVNGTIEKSTYERLAKFALTGALLAVALLGNVAFVIMSLVIGVYFLYSSAPFRLKRIPVISKCIIGINSFLMCLLGYVYFGAPAMTFPAEIAFFLLVPFSLAANFIDLKDEAGDKAAGIVTLPVLMGFQRSRWLILVFTLVSYATAAYIIWDALQEGVLRVGFLSVLAIHIYLLMRKKYNEIPVMAMYLLSMLLFVVMYAFKQ